MSDHSYIPKGFKTVSPYFIVNKARGFIEFLIKAFDAELVYEHYEKDRIIHSRVKIGNSLVEVSEASDMYPSKNFSFQLFVPDCDATYQKALEAGATSTGEPSDMPYGLRAGYIEDNWGNNWYISTQKDGKYDPEFWKDF